MLPGTPNNVWSWFMWIMHIHSTKFNIWGALPFIVEGYVLLSSKSCFVNMTSNVGAGTQILLKVSEVHPKSWSTNIIRPLPLHLMMCPTSLEWFSTSKEDEKNSTREYTKGKLTESNPGNIEDGKKKKRIGG